MSLQYGELRPTNGWYRLAGLGHPIIFQRVSRLGSVTARQSSSGRQPNFAALNRGRHLCSSGRPPRWALAHILVTAWLHHGGCWKSLTVGCRSSAVVRACWPGVTVSDVEALCWCAVDTQHSECAPAVQGKPRGAQRRVRHASSSAVHVPLRTYNVLCSLHDIPLPSSRLHLSHDDCHNYYYYYIRLTAFFQDNLAKSAPERWTILNFTGARDDKVAVPSAGPYGNHLHLTPDR